MSTAAAKHAKSEWVTKSEAETMLGISERQLERRSAQGYLEKKLGERGRHESRAPVFYSRADVEALKAGSPNVHAVAAPQNLQRSAATSTALAVAPPPAAARADASELLTALLLRQIEPTPAAAPSVGRWLSIEEASRRSGLPRYYLLREARAGAKWARNIGSEKAQRWRISAEGLDE